MNLRNEIILTFFVLLAFILFFNTDVFAVSNDNVVFSEIPDYVFSYVNNNISDNYSSDDYDYIYIKWNDDYQVHFINKGVNIYASSLSKFNVGYNHVYFILNFVDGVITKCTGPHTSNTGIINFSSTTSDGNTIIPLYSTCDIYTDNTYSSVFFHLPVTEVVIPALETAQEVPLAMIRTLKIIIPVGLVVFGIGLSVYLIRRILF